MILNRNMYVRAGQMAAPSCLGRGGKSGLHRTGCWVTPSPGDRRKVSQKTYRQAPNFQKDHWFNTICSHMRALNFSKLSEKTVIMGYLKLIFGGLGV